MTIGREDWLNLTKEAPIDPGLPICDSHEHLWKADKDRSQYLLEEFLSDSSGGHKIIKTVFIECGSAYYENGPVEMRPVGETEFTIGITKNQINRPYGQMSLAAAIVGYADLMLGEKVQPVLEAHLAVGKGRFKGIRQCCIWNENPKFISFAKNKEMMRDAKFRKGFACLQKYGLSFDAWQYFTQLEDLADLAKAFPNINMIINHAGGVLGIEQYSGRRKEIFEEWEKSMKKLAALSNVFVKLGGMGMPRSGFGWTELPKPPGSKEVAEKLSPYFSFCIETFGAGRCMFESNYPVDKASYSYAVIWNAFKLITQAYSPSERNLLFHDTAAKVYRLAK